MTLPTVTTCHICHITFTGLKRYNRHRRACFIQHEKRDIRLLELNEEAMETEEHTEVVEVPAVENDREIDILDLIDLPDNVNEEPEAYDLLDALFDFPSDGDEVVGEAMESQNRCDPMDLCSDETNDSAYTFEYKKHTSWTYTECMSVKLYMAAVSSNVSRKAYDNMVKIFNEFLQIVQNDRNQRHCPLLSYHLSDKLVKEEYDVQPDVYDVCRNGCILYMKDEPKTVCHECKEN
ncbi:hypothetical protein EC973_007229 [Apophysomyces ossiformis]|uniref:Uncharacterized protein n=1 Tax=Apophysomyces ossiformis TaxID=679940 RepID=A0A8H7BJH2_9FUNG|nr:hypothetical protein EC973_007229 [Apophysomyces ossiformis]